MCFVIGFLGEILKLPQWVIGLSPFQHTAQLPAANLTIAPIAILLAADAVLLAVGVGAFQRRDLT